MKYKLSADKKGLTKYIDCYRNFGDVEELGCSYFIPFDELTLSERFIRYFLLLKEFFVQTILLMKIYDLRRF